MLSVKKVIVLVFLLIFVVLFFVVNLNINQENKNQTNEVNRIKDIGSKNEKTIVIESSKSESKNGFKFSKLKLPEWVVNYDEVLNWKADHFGYWLLTDSEIANYDYTIEQLEELSENGDFLAMHVLAYKYTFSGEKEKANRINTKAAIYGSTYALRNLGSNYYYFGKDEKKKRQMLVERFAYFQAAVLRGDYHLLKDASIDMEVYKVELTDEDKRLVQVKGAAIYNRLETERLKFGLSKFDNVMPIVISDFFKNESLAYASLISGDSPLFTTKY